MPKAQGSRSGFANPPWWVGWILGYFVLIPALILIAGPLATIGGAIGWTILATTTLRTTLEKVRDPDKAARDEAREARRRQRDRL